MCGPLLPSGHVFSFCCHSCQVTELIRLLVVLKSLPPPHPELWSLEGLLFAQIPSVSTSAGVGGSDIASRAPWRCREAVVLERGTVALAVVDLVLTFVPGKATCLPAPSSSQVGSFMPVAGKQPIKVEASSPQTSLEAGGPRGGPSQGVGSSPL